MVLWVVCGAVGAEAPVTEPEGSSREWLKRALADAAWMYGCVGIGWLATQNVHLTWSEVAIRHGELFIHPYRERLLFAFTPLKRAGVDDGIALMLAEWVFIGIVAVACYIPIRWWRRRTGRMLLSAKRR